MNAWEIKKRLKMLPSFLEKYAGEALELIPREGFLEKDLSEYLKKCMHKIAQTAVRILMEKRLEELQKNFLKHFR